MSVERRAIYQIQAELKQISVKCDFERDWITPCIQFFSKHESKIQYVSPSYQIFSYGLLYYIIRTIDNSITMGYFSVHVLHKNEIPERKVLPVYRKLYMEFGRPEGLNFAVLANKTIDYLNLNNSNFKSIGIQSLPHTIMHVIRIKEFSEYLYSLQNRPRKIEKNELHGLVIEAYRNIKLL